MNCRKCGIKLNGSGGAVVHGHTREEVLAFEEISRLRAEIERLNIECERYLTAGVELQAENERLTAEREQYIPYFNAAKLLVDGHCKDCCCARSWTALGITKYTGESIPKHIEKLVADKEDLQKRLADLIDGSEYERVLKLARELAGAIDFTNDGLAFKPYNDLLNRPDIAALLHPGKEGEK